MNSIGVKPGKQRDLDQAFEAVRTFQPMDKAKLAELLARSHPYGRKGKYDPFEISATLDSAARTPQWRGDDVVSVAKVAHAMQ